MTVVLILAFLIGLVAGLRAMTAPAVVSWAARLGWINLSATPLAFLGDAWTPYIFTLAALAELVNDKLAKAGSRKAPFPFGVRIVSGALCGAALGAAAGQGLAGGLIAGAVGAVVGTLGGYELRMRLTRAAGGNGFPIALLEDALAIGLAFWAVTRLR
jgi:uncharacterized membrane protein